MISSADAGSAGYKSFCWLGRTVDSYLWKENTVFYSKKCCWEWRILASLGSYSQREQILKLDENIHWWHTARIPPLPWDCALQKSWNELVLKAPEWQIPVIPPEGWVRSSLAQFPHEAWLRAWQPPQRLFLGEKLWPSLTQVAHTGGMLWCLLMVWNCTGNLSFHWATPVQADTSVLDIFTAALGSQLLQQLDQTLLSWKMVL